MTDAIGGTGEDRERKGRTTGDTSARSPLVTPTGTEAPGGERGAREERGERRESVTGGTTAPGRSGEGGFGGGTAPGRDAGSDGVGGVGVGMGRTSSGHKGHEVQGHEAQGHEVEGHEARLLPHDECDKLSTRLQHAVAGFVDEPRSAVEEADHVLEEVATRFTEAVKQRRRTLRNSWQTGDGGRDKAVSAGDTEQLRLALRDYRELTERLLHS